METSASEAEEKRRELKEQVREVLILAASLMGYLCVT